MQDIRFYHLTQQTLEQALPKLMVKVVEIGMRALVKVPDKSYLDTLDKVLWDFDPASFLPHDKDGSAFPEDQNIYLTLGDENVNQSDIIVLVDNMMVDDVTDYKRCLYMFDGRNEAVVSNARTHWKQFKDAGVEMSYWQQTEFGGWEQKA
ncbi:DNA polymerase III subunit chi [Kordiimonas sp. SCSIO 12610]|uniref:DNA polymerase III subunit chi n=1 Tax=Kordiimonas sp. SCSIO 12610 TaxID=2829597 RepID=UPI00210E2EF8|nr:DNA polymerase III subunit chi [Kordiimonas sp. SCSIO 12610]UTW53878.1 DNA polymerase III subunit chi [Kordiimonas sp. SCSIO 12610]